MVDNQNIRIRLRAYDHRGHGSSDGAAMRTYHKVVAKAPWRSARALKGASQVSTWILSIARFKALSALRRRRETELDDTVIETIEDTADTPEQTVLNQDRSVQLRTCLAQMSREHREVIDLVYYHEKSVEEVAEIIQLPKNTVKTRMFYARKQLARLLSTHGDFDHLTAPQAA